MENTNPIPKKDSENPSTVFLYHVADDEQLIVLLDATRQNRVSFHKLPLQFFQKTSSSLSGAGPSSQIQESDGNGDGSRSPTPSHSRESNSDASPGPCGSGSAWELPNNRNPIQLNESYKSVSSVTSGASTSYMGRPMPEETHGEVRAISPTLPSSSIISRSPPLEGSQLDRPLKKPLKKKTAKNVLRETVINPQDMPGYKGEMDIDKLLEFVEGNPGKMKKPVKEKKREVKPKGNEKQVLSKAVSLDENTLGYGSKESDDILLCNRNIKEVEKKNATNITKTVFSAGVIQTQNKSAGTESSNVRLETKSKSISTPLMNGSVTPKNGNHSGPKLNNAKPSIKLHQSVEKVSSLHDVATSKPESVFSAPKSSDSLNKITVASTSAKKNDDDKFGKADESDEPYVLVQSKKKRERKKFQQREPDQPRRDVARARRSTAERRKSVGSVPGSENSECSDDDDSVRSLPAGECTPREKIPKPCSSSGGTPQTSYADIARMSKDENGKSSSTPIALLSSGVKTSSSNPSTKASTSAVVAVASDSNFPALSPPTGDQTSPVNAAIWPIRPLKESDTVAKDKSVSPVIEKEKPQEVDTNESCVQPEASPQSLLGQPESLKCSPKLSLESKSSSLEISVERYSNNEPSENVVEKASDGTLNITEVAETPASTQSQTSITITPDVGMTANILLLIKVTDNAKRADEKKAKDKSSKVQEELQSKSTSVKGSEPEPVVFCGGKFEANQPPVGQATGFEFGFGVIEALNCETGPVPDKIDTTSPSSSSATGSGADIERPTLFDPKFDIAQLYNSPEYASCPESSREMQIYMDEYAKMLIKLGEDGKLTYHRVEIQV